MHAAGISTPFDANTSADANSVPAWIASNPSPLQATDLQVWLNSGAGTFQAPHLIASTGVTLASQATADFNGDGIADLVTASTGQVQLGLGDGRFGDTTTLAFPSGIFSAAGGNSVAAVDVDGNGTADIVVGNGAYPTGQLAAWLNSPGYDNRTGGAAKLLVPPPPPIPPPAPHPRTAPAPHAPSTTPPRSPRAPDPDLP